MRCVSLTVSLTQNDDDVVASVLISGKKNDFIAGAGQSTPALLKLKHQLLDSINRAATCNSFLFFHRFLQT